MKFCILSIIFIASMVFGSVSNDVKLTKLVSSLNTEEIEQEKLDLTIEHIETTYTNLEEQLEAYNFVISKVGKYNLSKFSPKIKFYLSGPDKLEMFVLLKLKAQGLDNKTIKSILLAASGRYVKLGSESRKLLVSKGFSEENIEIIDNYEFLCSGGKLKLKDIVLMANSKVSIRDMADVIMNSQMKSVSFTREGAKFLESLGVPSEIVLLLVYRELFASGPNEYRVYDVLHDEKYKKISAPKIEKRISSTNWHYKDFSQAEEDVLQRAGISKLSIDAMRKQTAFFLTSSSDLASKYEKQAYAVDAKQERLNFVKREEIVKQVIANNPVFSGLANSTKEIASGKDGDLPKEKSTTERIGGCVAKTGANFLCSKAPWPASLACSAVADNYLKCE